MAQYIPKDAVVAEIERLKVHSEEAVQEFGREGYTDNVLFEQSKIRICETLLSLLDTLEVKEVDIEKEKKVCLDAITSWSLSENFGIMAEEVGELLSAMNKLLHGRAKVSDVITELADVSLVITAFSLYLGYDKFIAEKERRLLRLENRLKEWYKKNIAGCRTNRKVV